MDRLPENLEALAHALHLHRLGLRLIPLAGKRPLVQNWPDLHLAEAQLAEWAECGGNWGIITGDPLIIVDTDSDKAERWVQQHKVESPVMVRTGRGGLHRYFLQPEFAEVHSSQNLHGVEGLDVKGWRSFVVAVGSTHPETGRRYEYLPGSELGQLANLPWFNLEWIRPVVAVETLPSATTRPVPSGKVRDPRRYIRRIASIQGHGGDRACFTVACVLVRAGYSFDQVLAEMEAWSEECAFPTWSREQLIRKIRSAFDRIHPQGPPT